MNKMRFCMLAVGTVFLTLFLTACSNTEDNNANLANFNNQDVSFAQGMIPHHEQAVEMSDIILAKEEIDSRVMSLAAEIKNAQQPEIDQLINFLLQWEQKPLDDNDLMHDHSGHNGIMSDSDIVLLKNSTGIEASRLFLDQMIIHHEGAVSMSETQIRLGLNMDAVTMAKDIVETQETEIFLMKEILTSL